MFSSALFIWFSTGNRNLHALLRSMILKLKIAVFAFACGFEDDVDGFFVTVFFIQNDRFIVELAALNGAEQFFFASVSRPSGFYRWAFRITSSCMTNIKNSNTN